VSCVLTGGVSSFRGTSSSLHSRARHISTTRSSERTSTATSTKTLRLVVEGPSGRGLVDTSVVIAIDEVDTGRLPAEICVSTLTLAELSAGPHAVTDELKRARRQDRLQRFEADVEAIPFGLGCARAYGRLYAAVISTGRKARGARSVDLMIAATALANDLPLYTRNLKDLRGLKGLIEIVDVGV
jgi:predicted nucleic acid-binding protein